MQIPIAYGKDDHINLKIDEKNLLGVFDQTKSLNLTKQRLSQRL